MTYDASNRKDIRRAEKAAKIHERDRANYLIAAMSTRQGRLWFYDLLESCLLFSDPPTFDANKDYFFKGQRNVGLKIYEDIMIHCPDSYITMWKEANERRYAADRASTGERSEPSDTSGGDQESGDGDET